MLAPASHRVRVVFLLLYLLLFYRGIIDRVFLGHRFSWVIQKEAGLALVYSLCWLLSCIWDVEPVCMRPWLLPLIQFSDYAYALFLIHLPVLVTLMVFICGADAHSAHQGTFPDTENNANLPLMCHSPLLLWPTAIALSIVSAVLLEMGIHHRVSRLLTPRVDGKTPGAATLF